MPSFKKDPNATLDYTVDWGQWLTNETIFGTPTWVVPDGITKYSESNTVTTATIWLTGGTVGTNYDVVCRIVTTAGRVNDQTITIKVVER
jgi:hypothetical protein